MISLNFGKNPKRMLKLIENHLNLILLFIFVIIVLYASWLLYNFIYKLTTSLPKVSFEKVEIRKIILSRIIDKLDLRQENILEAMGKSYKDIFK